jgi:hypothetical protein
MWWKGMWYDSTSSAKSVWLDTTAAISTGNAPIRARNSRSFRQCPNLLTMSTTRIRSSARLICQSMWKESPIAAKLARSFSTVTGDSAEKWTRMKNSPVSWSPNCWLSSMLQPVMKR